MILAKKVIGIEFHASHCKLPKVLVIVSVMLFCVIPSCDKLGVKGIFSTLSHGAFLSRIFLEKLFSLLYDLLCTCFSCLASFAFKVTLMAKEI